MLSRNTSGLQRGAVSLFVVIFTALLMTIITVGFVRLMLQDQVQASSADLSKSASDAAQAGVEDAKRALIAYNRVCSDASSPDCARQTAIIDRGDCTTLQELGVAPASDKEVIIRQQESDAQFQEAYTCVKMQVNSPSYVGTLSPLTTRLIPLKGVSSFDRITIQWFSQSDIKNNSDGSQGTVDLATLITAPLPALVDWPKNRPALLRTQFIQFGRSFQLSDFDSNSSDGHSDSSTLFMYPSDVGRTDPINLVQTDARKSQTNGVLQEIACQPDLATVRYACQATLLLPPAIGESDMTRGGAYLRLDGIYNQSNNFSVHLFNGAQSVNFAGVQAIIDSTGRANDQFKRIESRIEADTNSFPYPQAAIDITGSLCKNFMITDNTTDYAGGVTACDPSKYTAPQAHTTNSITSSATASPSNSQP